MDGLINLHKPVRITSAKALYRVRRIVDERKSGHAGTLDPGASGVLLICLGRATKLVERVMDQPKVYRTTARLDVTSDTFDADGEVRSVPIIERPTADQVADALRRFEGEIEQTPPAISAVKVAGIPAYKRARSGENLVLRPRPARVYWIRLHRFDWPSVEFEMCCGRGTYVRAIVRDLGAALGTGGCVTALTRTRVGPFCIDDAWTFEAMERSAAGDYVIPLEKAMEALTCINTPDPPRSTGVDATRAIGCVIPAEAGIQNPRPTDVPGLRPAPE
jgi:tRNA pseudouridine55 synthase